MLALKFRKMKRQQEHESGEEAVFFLPRVLDAYPEDIVVDFRKTSRETLLRYLDHFEVPYRKHASTHRELSSLVGHHYAYSLKVEEERVIPSFAQYMISFSNDLSDAIRRSGSMVYAPMPVAALAHNDFVDVPKKRTRKRTRRAAAVEEDSDEDENPYATTAAAAEPAAAPAPAPEPERKRARSASVSAAAISAQAQAEEADALAPATPAAADVQVYCVCQRPSFGEMIGCDDEQCSVEWFHVQCVGIEPGEIRTGAWFCPSCTQSRQARAAAKKA